MTIILRDPKTCITQTLKGLSIDIEPGQNVAIVGPSGSGKSTVIQLIQQLYTSNSGKVYTSV